MENIVCSACKATKPRKDFKRLASLAQTKAWLRNPLATKRLTYIGKECNECHKQTSRKAQDLTPNELRKRLINEGVNPLKIEIKLAKRRAQGAKKKSVSASRVMRERHKANKANKAEQ